MARRVSVRNVNPDLKDFGFLHPPESSGGVKLFLNCDELEALKLADIVGLYHDEAALNMNISRATFGRILASARRKTARSIIDRIPLSFSQNNVRFKIEKIRCPIHDTKKRKGRFCLCERYGDKKGGR